MFRCRIATHAIGLYEIDGTASKYEIHCGDVFFVLSVGTASYTDIFVMLSDGTTSYVDPSAIHSYSQGFNIVYTQNSKRYHRAL